MATPFMSLSLPTPSVTPGPDWSAALNTALTTIDGHNHTPGSGTQVPSAGILVNADLSFGNNNATTLRSSRFYSQSSPIAGASDIGCLYVSGGNLYYNNGAGQQIQLTAGAALNATSVGAISGDFATSTATEFYTSATTTFTFWSNSNKYATIDAGNHVIREPGVTSPNAITLKSPTSLAASYNLTLPTALPASSKLITLSSTGAITPALDAAAPIFTGLVTAGGGLTTNTSYTPGAAGDAIIARTSTAGSIYFGNPANNVYFGYDGTVFQAAGKELANVAPPSVTTSAATRGYVDTNPRTAKAWAYLTISTLGSVTVNGSYNVASASYSTNALTINFSSALGNNTYAAVSNTTQSPGIVSPNSFTTSSFIINQFNTTNGANLSYNLGTIVWVIVFGN